MNLFRTEERCFKVLVGLKTITIQNPSNNTAFYLKKGDVFIGKALAYYRTSGKLSYLAILYKKDVWDTFGMIKHTNADKLLDILQPIEFPDIWEMKRNGTWKQPNV